VGIKRQKKVEERYGNIVRRDMAIGVRVFHNSGRMRYKGLGKTFDRACGGDLGRGKVEELRPNSGVAVSRIGRIFSSVRSWPEELLIQLLAQLGHD
jgi:hypothetical protein